MPVLPTLFMWLTAAVKQEFNSNPLTPSILRTMTNLALITLLLSQGIVTAFTGYFLWKVLNSPPESTENSTHDSDGDVA